MLFFNILLFVIEASRNVMNFPKKTNRDYVQGQN